MILYTKILKTKQKLKNQHFLDPSEKLSHRLSHCHPNWREKYVDTLNLNLPEKKATNSREKKKKQNKTAK